MPTLGRATRYAVKKGHSYGLVFLIALLTWVIAIVVVLLLPDRSQEHPRSPESIS